MFVDGLHFVYYHNLCNGSSPETHTVIFYSPNIAQAHDLIYFNASGRYISLISLKFNFIKNLENASHFWGRKEQMG